MASKKESKIIEDVEAEAKKLKAEAKAEAAKIKDKAETIAEKIKDKAEEEGDAIKAEAEKIKAEGAALLKEVSEHIGTVEAAVTAIESGMDPSAEVAKVELEGEELVTACLAWFKKEGHSLVVKGYSLSTIIAKMLHGIGQKSSPEKVSMLLKKSPSGVVRSGDVEAIVKNF